MATGIQTRWDGSVSATKPPARPWLRDRHVSSPGERITGGSPTILIPRPAPVAGAERVVADLPPQLDDLAFSGDPDFARKIKPFLAGMEEIARSEGFILNTRRYKDRTAETYHISFNPRHEWFYFPEMTRNEALVFKVFDSDTSVTEFTAHTSFEDPNTPPDAPFRESIETRTFAFWD